MRGNVNEYRLRLKGMALASGRGSGDGWLNRTDRSGDGYIERTLGDWLTEGRSIIWTKTSVAPSADPHIVNILG